MIQLPDVHDCMCGRSALFKWEREQVEDPSISHLSSTAIALSSFVIALRSTVFALSSTVIALSIVLSLAHCTKYCVLLCVFSNASYAYSKYTGNFQGDARYLEGGGKLSKGQNTGSHSW
jgi:hypothetical protein